MSEYSELLKDPRWQKKRLEIMERDKWCCAVCHDKTNTLMVHHKYYEHGRAPWDYPDESLVTLCEFCHTCESKDIRESLMADALESIKRKFLYGDLLSLSEALASPYYDEIINTSDIIFRRVRQSTWKSVRGSNENQNH